MAAKVSMLVKRLKLTPDIVLTGGGGETGPAQAIGDAFENGDSGSGVSCGFGRFGAGLPGQGGTNHQIRRTKCKTPKRIQSSL